MLSEKLISKAVQTNPYVLVEMRCRLFFSMVLLVPAMEKPRYQKIISLNEAVLKKLVPTVLPVNGSFVIGQPLGLEVT